jgi:hypothetical protein
VTVEITVGGVCEGVILIVGVTLIVGVILVVILGVIVGVVLIVGVTLAVRVGVIVGVGDCEAGIQDEAVIVPNGTAPGL